MGKPAQGHTAHQQRKGSGTQDCAAPKLFPRRCKDPPAQLCFLYKRSHWLLHPAGTPSLRADCVQVVRLQDAQAPRGLLLYPVSPGSSSPAAQGPWTLSCRFPVPLPAQEQPWALGGLYLGSAPPRSPVAPSRAHGFPGTSHPHLHLFFKSQSSSTPSVLRAQFSLHY